MNKHPKYGNLIQLSASLAAILCTMMISNPVAAQTNPVASAPYSVTVFAKSQNGYSQPDSIVRWHNTVLVAFQNNVAKDGTDGKSSTIVQYSLKGDVLRTFSVPGHNDGLRLIGKNHLWALQNEDANPNLAIINLKSGNNNLYTFSTTAHGGGYDDMVVVNGEILMTASNPNLDAKGVNVYPALVKATLSGNMVNVEPLLYGNDSATDIATGNTVTLNLTDPDSLTVDPRGNVVLDSQADSELVFISNPLGSTPHVGRINLTSSGAPITADDTSFAHDPAATLLVTDLKGDTIYQISSGPFGFEPGTAYQASDAAGTLGVVNLDNGIVTPVVTGFGSPRGLLFLDSRKVSNRKERETGPTSTDIAEHI